MLNEADTRANHIDPALKAAGWDVVEGSSIRREFYITPGRLEGNGKHGKQEKADYVLFYRNHKLAVVEAKRWDLPHTEGAAQAKSYAQKLAVRYTYSTNGQAIYGIDMANGQEQDVPCFPSPQELWHRTFVKQNDWRDRFAEIPFEDKGGYWSSRYYQDIAVDNVLEAIAAGQPRILLTLATGTGKTFIAFQIAWKLFRSRWNLQRDAQRRPRILFLADRNILANQAFNAFSAFPEDALVRIEPDDIRKKGRVPKNGSIFFTIFQTFMSGPQKDGKASPYFGEYPPDFFDFIVIDECHRGGAENESTWRGILEYFKPAVQLGLTATPKHDVNADTYDYFGKPVFVYSLKEGISDGFLTPFKVREITTTLDDYVYTEEDDLLEGEAEAGQHFDEADMNRIIEIKQREAYRVKVFMDILDQREKTLVFCASQPHALAVRDLINQIKTSQNPNYCARVTARDGARGEQFLRDFQDNEKNIPTILTTSRKLSTGVDARNVRNIVLMRPIRSIIEFKQIIGRGTRLYDDKDYFTIYDFVNAHEHFQDAEWDGEPLGDTRVPGSGRPDNGKPAAEDEGAGTHREAPKKIKVRLRDGKELTIQHTIVTTFWGADGKPLTAPQFVETFFGKLPELFQSEEELRARWSAPDTRTKLLQELADKEFGRIQLAEMQKIIDAEDSDLFDVLTHVAYGRPLLSRVERAQQARSEINTRFNNQQQAFLEYVLAQYVQVGVETLEQEKLTPLLKLKYNNALADAVADLGTVEQIRALFSSFQQYLYKKQST